jgi:hypothetical protein
MFPLFSGISFVIGPSGTVDLSPGLKRPRRDAGYTVY